MAARGRQSAITPRDFSIIMVTYNRPNEIMRNFRCLARLKSKPREIIVVDQSENGATRKICSAFSRKMGNLKYIYSKRPSIAASKNIGVARSSPKSKVLLFLDDDAYVEPDYLDEIAYYYNALGANGIFGFDCEKFGSPNPKTFTERLKFSIGKMMRRIFLLGYVGDSMFSVTSPYGANSTLHLSGPVPAQWFPGTDPSYRRELLLSNKFDENFFWWSLGEDVDISYRLHRKYGKLYVVPASLSHKHPLHEDDLTRKIRKIYMNQINHFYLFYKLMPDMRLRFAWNLFGISLLRSFALLQPGKFSKRRIEWKFFFKSLAYSIRNRGRIMKGDLSIPYPSK